MKIKLGDKVYSEEKYLDKLGMIVPANEVGVVRGIDRISYIATVDFPSTGITQIPMELLNLVPDQKSGTEQQSARHNSGKTQVREIDPDFIMGIGEVLTASREFYDEGNWMKETKLSTPYESCMRHLLKFWNGEDFDEQTKKSHLLHAATNLMFLYFHMSSGKGIDDRLFKKDKK